MALAFESTGDGPPVVLVQGAAPLAWGRLPERLAAAGRRVITYARRGFPPNERLGLASSLREHVDDLVELLTTCGRSTVVGWSSGGVVGLDAALRRPDLLSGLVVIEPPLHAKRRPSFGMLRAVLGAQLKARTDGERGARQFLDWALGRTDGAASDLGRLDEEGVRQAAAAIVHELRYATGEREIPRGRLEGLGVDTTWLVGTASVAGNRRLALRAARRARRIRVEEVAGAGHAVALDAPDVVARAATA